MADWVDRYWEKVDVRGPDECWEWMAATTKGGYGHLFVDGKVTYAHRLSWELAHGPIPEGLCVLHQCDHRWCVNPAHLSIGTVADNQQDMARKGRGHGVRGSRNALSKFARADILQVRRLYKSGDYTQQELADRFGMSPRTVCHIVNRTRWAWLKAQ